MVVTSFNSTFYAFSGGELFEPFFPEPLTWMVCNSTPKKLDIIEDIGYDFTGYLCNDVHNAS